MENYYKHLSKKYDEEIRVECRSKEYLVDDCLKDNFNDKDMCIFYINNFTKCTEDFDNKFRKKYNLKKYIKD